MQHSLARAATRAGRRSASCRGETAGRIERLEPRRLYTTTAALLADLTVGPTPATLTPGAAVGGVVYAGRDGSAGGELWRSDGTAAGTKRLAVVAGADGDEDAPTPEHLTAFDGGVAFSVDGSVYFSDGTTDAPTVLVADTSGGYELEYDEASIATAVVGGRLWISTDQGLYASDGSAAGTTQVTGAAGTDVPAVATAGGAFYAIRSGSGTTPTALLRTDGTAAGTVAVATGSIAAVGLAGQTVVYTTQDQYPQGPLDLYALAGDAPVLVRSFATRSDEFSAAAGASLGGTFDFAAEDTGQFPSLWRTDGTAAGTASVTGGPSHYAGAPADLTVVGGRVLYVGESADLLGESLYASDGTAAGTVAVLTREPAATSTALDTQSVSFSAPVISPDGGLAYSVATFEDFSEVSGLHTAAAPELFRTDGTAANSAEVGVAPSTADVFGNATPDAAGGAWLTDKDATGTLTLWHAAGPTIDAAAAVVLTGTELSSTDPTDLQAGSPQSYFTVAPTDGSSTTADLWHTDGTAAGTAELAGAGGPYAPVESVLSGDDLIFTAEVGYYGAVYRTDGTPAGTVELLSGVGPDDVDPTDPQLFADGVGGAYFVGYTESPYTPTLFHTDGTAAGTVAVMALPGGVSVTLNGAAAGGKFYFSLGGGVTATSTADEVVDAALYVSDGTPAGTTAVFTPAVGDGGIRSLAAVGTDLFFQTDLAVYVADGTATGTAELAALLDANLADGVYDYVTAAAGPPQTNGLFYTVNGTQLWHTGGTAATTGEVFDATTVGGAAPSIADLTDVVGRAYFTLADPAHGLELWSSNGTAAGTALLTDTDPGAAGGDPNQLTAAGSTLFFTADDGLHGRELWATDGTAAGAAMVADIYPGVGSSNPSYLSATPDGQVLFAADDNADGTELWHTAGGPADTGTNAPPTAVLAAAVQPVNGAATVAVTVTYSDAAGIDADTLGSTAAVTLTGPGGAVLTAASAVADAGTDPTGRTVTYTFAAPGGKLTAADNGTYTASVAAIVANVAGTPVAAGTLGQFTVDVPTTGVALATTVAVSGPAAAVGGAKGTARVTLRNAGTVAADGTVTVELLLSTTATGGPGATTPITTVAVAVRLKPGQRRTAAVRFTYPTGTTDGTRYVLAVADADGKLPQVDATAATAASPAVSYRHASGDLSATAGPVKGRRGKRATAVVHVRNAGSVTATGTVSLTLTVSGGSLAAAMALPAVVRPALVRAGATKAVAVPFTVPAGLAAGTYTLTAALSPSTGPADADAADKSAVTTLTVV